MLTHNAQGSPGSPKSTQLPGTVSSDFKSGCDFSPDCRHSEEHWLRPANDIPSTETFPQHCAESTAAPQCSDPCKGIGSFSAASPFALGSHPHQCPCPPLAGTTCTLNPLRAVFRCWMMNLPWMSSTCLVTWLSSFQPPSPHLPRRCGPLQVSAGETLLHCWLSGEALEPWLSSDHCTVLH